MFGHDGDDYDEELICNDRFLQAANQMYAENYSRQQVYSRLCGMKCDRQEALRICNYFEKTQQERKLKAVMFVNQQKNVRDRNFKEREQESRANGERKIGISRIRDDDDLVRHR